MEMTTPVYTTAGQGDGGKMAFPMEEKLGEEEQQLPIPNNARCYSLSAITCYRPKEHDFGEHKIIPFSIQNIVLNYHFRRRL